MASGLANPLQPRASTRAKPFEKETTVGSTTGRNGALYWRPLGPLLEVTLYPLLWGAARLTFGRRDKDAFIVGYDYVDHQSGLRAAEEWDGKGEPPHGPVRKVAMDEKRRIQELEL